MYLFPPIQTNFLNLTGGLRSLFPFPDFLKIPLDDDKNSIREGDEIQIIDSPENWFVFLEHRNLAAHTYNEMIADRVYEKAVNFPAEIDGLVKKIKTDI